jgi:2-dehydro-3-deoxy-L-rhamnonate dehydrogenase (NAD+)
MNQLDLNGRVAIVTRGASGIGLAVAQRLAHSGALLALWDLSEAALPQAADKLRGTVKIFSVDVSNRRAGRCCVRG